MQTTLYLIHGFVGSGKTTFSKKLERETRAVRFTPDEWMCDLYGSNPPAEMYAEYENRIEKIIQTMSEKMLAAGVSVIWDFGFWSRSSREFAREWGKQRNVAVKLYALQCTDDIMRERVLARTAELPYGAMIIDENAIAEFKKRFDPVVLDGEESTVIYT